MTKPTILELAAKMPIIDIGEILFHTSYSFQKLTCSFSETKYSQILNAAYQTIFMTLDINKFRKSKCKIKTAEFQVIIDRIYHKKDSIDFCLLIKNKSNVLVFILEQPLLYNKQVAAVNRPFSYFVHFDEVNINMINRDDSKILDSFLTWSLLTFN